MRRLLIIALAFTATACTADDAEPAGPVSDVVVTDRRVVEGADLCRLATAEELEWLLDEPLAGRPRADPAAPGACAADFTASTVTLAGRTTATGARGVVAGNTAFTEAGDDGCRVSVALLPGSTPRAGSYLEVGVTGDRSQACRTAGRVAGYLLRQLPRH